MSTRAWFRVAVFLVGIAETPLCAQQDAIPTSIQVLVLPSSGDVNTVVPIAVRETIIAAAGADGVIAPNANCDQPAVTPLASVTNPSGVAVDDPWHPGRTCRAVLPQSIPDGSGYRAVAVFVASQCRPDLSRPVVVPCPGARSLVGAPPFDRASVVNPPAIPTRVVVVP
jgi:hypothetical protein